MLNEVVDRFNAAAKELQATEFRHPRSPDEWQRMAQRPRQRDYTKLFNAVVPLIEAFATANSSERARVAPKLNPDGLGILRTFASSMPVLAVRQESPVLITQGLTAVAVLGGIEDTRDLTFYLCTLHHSAMKLGVDTRKVFGDVASLASSVHLQQEMRGFPSRPPKDKDLVAFRFREVLTDDGFDLVQDSW